MLQIGRFEEAKFFGGPTKYYVKPFQFGPVKCAPEIEGADGKSWQQALRDNVSSESEG